MSYTPVNPKPPTRRPEDRLPIRALQLTNLLFTSLYHRVRCLSPCRLPPDGPAILVCNHTSGVDPLLIQSACQRLIVWMMAAEYDDLPVLRTIFRTIHVIPTTRSGRDLSAVRAALRALQQGHILGLFPEGRIAQTHELLPFETGVSLLALRAGVPVYPAYLDGTQRNRTMLGAFLRPCSATIRFGPALHLTEPDTSRDSLHSATARVQSAVAALSEMPRRIHQRPAEL
jgi:1-acyl-sn-glycerol-3-phosphate acyltransferase